jgi:subtilisin family serine protease
MFMVGVPLSTGRHVWELLSNSTATTVTATFGDPAGGLPPYEHLASFSSYGPTADGRIKPDIVAPGTLLSAKSDGKLSGSPDSCATKRSQGTSMAAPVVTGSVTLIRQYFTDGFYPTGAKVPANGFKPSGPLIKGTLLGGASNMLGNTAVRGRASP